MLLTVQPEHCDIGGFPPRHSRRRWGGRRRQLSSRTGKEVLEKEAAGMSDCQSDRIWCLFQRLTWGLTGSSRGTEE